MYITVLLVILNIEKNANYIIKILKRARISQRRKIRM